MKDRTAVSLLAVPVLALGLGLPALASAGGSHTPPEKSPPVKTPPKEPTPPKVIPVLGADFDCTIAAVTWDRLPAGTYTLPYEVVIDGTPVPGVHTFDAPAGKITVPLSLVGTHRVALRAGLPGKKDLTTILDEREIDCPVPAVVTPPTPEVTPPIPPVVVVTPVTPVVTPKPKPKPPRKPVKRFTCADIPAKAGIGWFDGSRLKFKCPLPSRLRTPTRVLPPVTG